MVDRPMGLEVYCFLWKTHFQSYVVSPTAWNDSVIPATGHRRMRPP